MDPENLAKLMADERTRTLMTQPDFMSLLKECEENPQMMQKYMEDERMQLVLEVIFGLKIRMKPGENGGPMQMDASLPEEDVSRAERRVQEEEQKKTVEEPKEEENPEKKRAYGEKEEGNKAYKAKSLMMPFYTMRRPLNCTTKIFHS